MPLKSATDASPAPACSAPRRSSGAVYDPGTDQKKPARRHAAARTLSRANYFAPKKYLLQKYLLHVSVCEPTGFGLCAKLRTSQTPTLVPTANNHRDFLFCRCGLPLRRRALRLLAIARAPRTIRKGRQPDFLANMLTKDAEVR